MRSDVRVLLITAAVVASPAASRGVAQHAGDVWVGRSAAGQVKLSPLGFTPERNYASLGWSAGLPGWTNNSPGFDRITNPEPPNDVYVLHPGCAIWLELVAADPAFKLIDGDWEIIDQPGETTFLGGSTLHVHNTWWIDRQDPGYDADQCVWRSTWRLHDTGGTAYTPSETFTFNFANVPWGPRRVPPVYAAGDFEPDGDVDVTDFAAIAECLNGPDAFTAPDNPAITLCEVDCVNAFDFGLSLAEVDLDVDLADFATFQTAFTGVLP